MLAFDFCVQCTDLLIVEFHLSTAHISSDAEKLLLEIACLAMGCEALTVLCLAPVGLWLSLGSSTSVDHFS